MRHCYNTGGLRSLPQADAARAARVHRENARKTQSVRLRSRGTTGQGSWDQVEILSGIAGTCTIDMIEIFFRQLLLWHVQVPGKSIGTSSVHVSSHPPRSPRIEAFGKACSDKAHATVFHCGWPFQHHIALRCGPS